MRAKTQARSFELSTADLVELLGSFRFWIQAGANSDQIHAGLIGLRPLVYRSTFHDEAYILEHTNVVEGISRDSD